MYKSGNDKIPKNYPNTSMYHDEVDNDKNDNATNYMDWYDSTMYLLTTML